MATDNDVRMNGGGSVGGGSYDNVTINGTGVLNGDLTAAARRPRAATCPPKRSW